MTIGNKPKAGDMPIEGKTYWWLAIGRGAVSSRLFDGGWTAVEFLVFKPYEHRKPGEAAPYRIRIAFAFWLPIYFL